MWMDGSLEYWLYYHRCDHSPGDRSRVAPSNPSVNDPCLSVFNQTAPSIIQITWKLLWEGMCTHLLSWGQKGTTFVWEKGVTVNCPAEHNHLSIGHPLQCLCQTNNDREKTAFCTGCYWCPLQKKKKKKRLLLL